MLSRQCSNHYTFRAGQNLPDKEFRYLRPVIVTAAVHWGFNSALARLLLTFQHWAGVSPYTSSFDFAETCVFAKQLPGPIHCGSPFREHPFSRSYGVNLPSSLTTLLPLALESSINKLSRILRCYVVLFIISHFYYILLYFYDLK